METRRADVILLSKRVIRGSEVRDGRLHKSSIRCLISHIHLSSRGIDGDQRAYHVEAGATTRIQHEVSRTEGTDDRLCGV